MVVVGRLEDIIAEERQLEDELRRLSLSAIKVDHEQVAPPSPCSLVIPKEPGSSRTVSRTVAILKGLQPINTLSELFGDIRKATFQKYKPD